MIFAKIETLPPFVCRLVAREPSGHKAMSTSAIAARAGISRSYVSHLSHKTTWRGVPINVADSFATACGVDLNRPLLTLRWLRRSGLEHLKTGNAHQRRFFKTLFTQRTHG